MDDQVDIDTIITVKEKVLDNQDLFDHDHDPNRKFICKPYEYLNDLPSNNNNIRAKFIEIFAELFFGESYSTNCTGVVNEIITKLHISSLLIDDIEDNSKYRRGFPAAHVKYGKPSTINCANRMYFEAMEIAYSDLRQIHSRKPDYTQRCLSLHQAFVLEMINLHNGQGLDIYWRDFLPELEELPTIEEYLSMVQNKTGGLFRLSVKLLDVFSRERPEQKQLDKVLTIANLAGIIYQVRDDYLNLVDARYSTMKGIAGEDLLEGKLSLPILFNLRNEEEPEKSPVHKILYDFRSLKLRSKQKDLLQKAVSYLHERGSMSQTYLLLRNLKIKFHALLEEVGFGDSELYKLIERLCDV